MSEGGRGRLNEPHPWLVTIPTSLTSLTSLASCRTEVQQAKKRRTSSTSTLPSDRT